MSRIEAIRNKKITIETINAEKEAKNAAIREAVHNNKRGLFGVGSAWKK